MALIPSQLHQLCRTHPGGQSAGGPELLATVTTYDLYQQPRSQVEKTTAGVLRTMTLGYDAAGRLYESKTVAAAEFGASMPKQRQICDEPTGQLVRTQSVDDAEAVIAEIVRSAERELMPH